MTTPIEILLVEDSETDVLLTQEALRFSQIENKLYRVENGVEALQFLRNEGEYASRERPDIILLDVNMPRMSGLELLEIIKVDDQLKSIPVVVFTTSKAEDDISRSYELHANSYVTKPAEFSRLTKVVRDIYTYWSNIASLAPNPR